MKGIRVNVTAVETNMVFIVTTLVLVIKTAMLFNYCLKFSYSWIWRMDQNLPLRNCARV